MYFIGSHNWKVQEMMVSSINQSRGSKLYHQDLISIPFCINFCLLEKVLACSCSLSHSNYQTFSHSSPPHLREKGLELVALKVNESVKNTSNSYLRVGVLQDFEVLSLMLLVRNCIWFWNLNLLIFLLKLVNDIEIIGYLIFLL